MTLRNPDIDLRLGVEATRERLLAEKPDAVIVAVGAEPIVPPVDGVDGENVCLAQDIDRGLFKPGKRVVIVGAAVFTFASTGGLRPAMEKIEGGMHEMTGGLLNKKNKK